ncbi:MAG: site-2 protease family protein [Gammaproteobacteria bacterium]
MQDLPVFYQILIWSLPVLFAITLHEVGHGWAAKQLGDPTAEQMGRLTLNPFKHIDPMGTVVVPLVAFFLSGFIFGWAKPVPVNWGKLRNRKRDIALVALAGPGANLAMIVIWLLLAKMFMSGAEQNNIFAMVVVWMAWAGIIINSLLMILNLFPIPPLDGSRVVYSLLPDKVAYQYLRLEPFGLIILVVLLVTGILFKVMGPILLGFQQLMFQMI